MIKYPELYTVKQFLSIVQQIPELLDHECFVQPKYDGSNVTCFAGVCLSRGLNPLPSRFSDGLKKALEDKYESLIRLSNKYQVFIELGGYMNSPAGFTASWKRDWDYRVFDLFAGVFLSPDKVMRILEKYGLEYVGHDVMSVEDVVSSWKRLLAEKYSEFEGFVLKIYPSNTVLKRIRHHRQRNAVIVKFKHEYAGIPVKKPKKKKKTKPMGDKKEPLPESEIMGAINKAHLLLGDEIFDKKKAMPVIFRLVREEAEKHGNSVPSASKLFRYYQRYLENVR